MSEIKAIPMTHNDADRKLLQNALDWTAYARLLKIHKMGADGIESLLNEGIEYVESLLKHIQDNSSKK